MLTCVGDYEIKTPTRKLWRKYIYSYLTQDDGHVFIPIFSTKYVGASTTYAKYMMMKK